MVSIIGPDSRFFEKDSPMGNCETGCCAIDSIELGDKIGLANNLLAKSYGAINRTL